MRSPIGRQEYAHPYRLSTDELVQYLNQPAPSNGTPTCQEFPCEDGRPCILIVMQESFPQPITNPGEDPAFWLLKDGSKLVSFTKNNLLVEKVASPPQEILDILAKVVVP